MNTVAIAGGHGSIALHLTRILTSRGVDVRSLVRNPDHQTDIEQAGGTMRLVDLEQDTVEEMAAAIDGVDAVVFAAGAGGGSSAERKETVDYGGAVKLKDACEVAGVQRYLMVSSMGTDDPPEVGNPDEDVFAVYLQAKARADAVLMASPLRWTIVRPGRLTDDAGTGQVQMGRHVDRASIPREDVAAVLDQLLQDDSTAGVIAEVVSGHTTIPAAVAHLRGG